MKNFRYRFLNTMKLILVLVEFKALNQYLYSTTNVLNSKVEIPKSTRMLYYWWRDQIELVKELSLTTVVAACKLLTEMGAKQLCITGNPETVSTDYFMFYTLSQSILNMFRSVVEKEQPDGVIVHFGGQTPLKLVQILSKKDWSKNYWNNSRCN